MGCPFNYISGKLRGDLPPLTARLARLPVDKRGYPVPFFVGWKDGEPDFRLADGEKLRACIKFKLCWVCGENLGKHQTFVIGPMCAVNRTSAEPPSHRDCAEWSVHGCPFLSKPHMIRREDDTTKAHEGNVAGTMIKRNPGVMLLWETDKYTIFPDGRGGLLFDVGEPQTVSWWREGRPALPEECRTAIGTGVPILAQQCDDENDFAALASMVVAALSLLPGSTYRIARDGKSITCHKCGRTSWHLKDVEHRYCGHCKEFH